MKKIFFSVIFCLMMGAQVQSQETHQGHWNTFIDGIEYQIEYQVVDNYAMGTAIAQIGCWNIYNGHLDLDIPMDIQCPVPNGNGGFLMGWFPVVFVFPKDCNITSIKIGYNYNRSFSHDTQMILEDLTSIEVVEGHEKYSSKDGVLYNSDKTSLTRYPAGKTGDSFVIPETVTTIELYAFGRCTNLTSITIPESVTNIGLDAFSGSSYALVGGCSLASIEVVEGHGKYSSKDGVLYNSDKTSLIRYPAGKTGENFVIPETVTMIGRRAFESCTNLTSITIPESVTNIVNDAFWYCNSLTSIINLNPIPVNILSLSVFSNFNKAICWLYVPAGSKEAYQNPAYEWQDFNIIELPEISENDVTITSSENGALIEWQPYENAEGYRLIIYSNEAHSDTVYVLEFSATGELIPKQAKSSIQTANTNISHTINNLSSSTYYYTLEILGVGNAVLASLSSTFATDITVDIVEKCRAASLPEIVGYYNILGAKLPKEPASGIYIILYDNGSAENVVK